MKQVFISNKGLSVQDVPAPLVETGQILVRLHYSCISTGTEISGVSVSDTPLWKRAAENPQKVNIINHWSHLMSKVIMIKKMQRAL